MSESIPRTFPLAHHGGGLRVRLTQLDGVLPNLALMKLSHWHKARGDEVHFSRSVDPNDESHISRDMFEPVHYDRVYGSAIFKFSQTRLMRFQRNFPGAIIGGTGTTSVQTVEEIIAQQEREDAGWGEYILDAPPLAPVEYEHYDYSLYPDVSFSMGFTQRGCRLSCKFCVVPTKEGKPRSVNTIADIWRGSPQHAAAGPLPWPKHLHLLDNDFFGQPREAWQARIEEIRAGKFKVALTQGINVRMIDDESAAAIASIDYREGTKFKDKRLYTAWDNKKDEARLVKGLETLAKHGVKPDHIMVYMLIGFWKGETEADWLHRQATLRAFGARPYPMPFLRTKETVGFQRWVVGAYDKRKEITWDRWKAANYQPNNLS